MLNQNQLARFAELFKDKIKPAILSNEDNFIEFSNKAREFLTYNNSKFEQELRQGVMDGFREDRSLNNPSKGDQGEYELVNPIVTTKVILNSTSLENISTSQSLSFTKVKLNASDSSEKMKFAA